MTSPLSVLRRLRDRMSMRQQSALFTALLSLATVIAMTVATAHIVREQAIETAGQDIDELAQSMAERLDRHMFERYREIANLASLTPVAGNWSGDATDARKLLDQLQDTLPSYAWIGFAEPNGAVQAATQGMLEGVSVAERPWFKAGLLKPSVLDIHEAKLLAKLLGPATADGDPFRFVDVAAPVRDGQGEVRGVLGAHLSWSWAKDVRAELLSSFDPSLQTDLWVTSADGLTILGPEFGKTALSPQQIAQSKNRKLRFIEDTSGRRHLAAVVATQGAGTYQGLGWRVIARRPLDVALSDANSVTLTIFALGVVAAVASIAAAFVIAGRVTEPLTRLTANADKIGRDPDISLIDRQSGSRDIVQLSNSLRSLIRRIDFAETTASQARAEASQSAMQISIEAAKHEEAIMALRQIAETDPMTGLPNRRGFLSYATDVFRFFRRYDRSFGILMIDIDHFKKINDTHGHLAGDAVIKAIGQILADAARSTDRVARFGGEEFVVLLREVDNRAVELWAERIRQKIDEAGTPWNDRTLVATVSIGATLAAADDRDVEDVIHRADMALYEAKANGRNRVILRLPPLRAANAA